MSDSATSSLRGRKNLTWAERMAAYRARLNVIEGGCWLWRGKIRGDGYGVVCIDYKDRLIHRVFYERLVGATGPGTNIHHLCGEKSCCNPDHLSLLSVADHAREHGSISLAQDASAAARRSLTHCKWGHEFTQANTYISKSGGRYCRECNRLRAARRAAA